MHLHLPGPEETIHEADMYLPRVLASVDAANQKFMIAVLANLTYALKTTKKELAMLSYPVD